MSSCKRGSGYLSACFSRPLTARPLCPLHGARYGYNFEVSDEVLSADYVCPIGKAKIQREGTDVTLVSHSKAMVATMEAARQLEEEGISCEVVNLRSIRPLDMDTINASVMKTNR